MIRNGMNYHRTCPDLGVVAHRNVSEDLGSCSDHDIVPDGWVAFAFFLARSAQRHALVHKHVLADFGGFADHHAHAVVDKTSPANGRPGMNFDACKRPDEL